MQDTFEPKKNWLGKNLWLFLDRPSRNSELFCLLFENSDKTPWVLISLEFPKRFAKAVNL